MLGSTASKIFRLHMLIFRDVLMEWMYFLIKYMNIYVKIIFSFEKYGEIELTFNTENPKELRRKIDSTLSNKEKSRYMR